MIQGTKQQIQATFLRKGGLFCLVDHAAGSNFERNKGTDMRNQMVVLGAMLFGWMNMTFSQEYVHQVFVFNEGWSNWQTEEVIVPATLGVYDPGVGIYEVVDTVEGAGFISDAIMWDERLYVAADGQLLVYDANTYELVNSTAVQGIRQLAMLNGIIYATRGDVDESGLSLPLSSYLQWFDAMTLDLEGELLVSAGGPQYSTEGIEAFGNRLYFGINNAFDYGNEVGIIGCYVPLEDVYEEWDLGENGKNPYHLFVQGDQVVTVNNMDYGSTSISVVDAESDQVNTALVSEANAGCLAAVFTENELRYQITGEGIVRSTLISEPSESQNWLSDSEEYYGMALDPISNNLFASVTDYVSFGFVEIRNDSGILLSQFDCGVSPGVICLDIRTSSGLNALLPQSEVPAGCYDLSGRVIEKSNNAAGVKIHSDGSKTFSLGRD